MIKYLGVLWDCVHDYIQYHWDDEMEVSNNE